VDADVLGGVVRAQFPNARVEVRGGDGRYEVIIVSEAFRDLSRVKRQQLVYGCLTDHIKDGSVHAVTIQAKTPDEV
jgi:acid stress-induced BolA-like protein IbaG/YrbA